MNAGRSTWIAPALARARASRIRDLRYELDLTLDRRARMLSGTQAITLSLDRRGAREDLVIDWRPECGKAAMALSRRSLRINGEPVRRAGARIGQGHLVVAAPHLRAGFNRIELQWQAPIRDAGGALTRYLGPEDGGPCVYTLFVPADASQVFPCFDQPDLKARFTLTLALPPGWTAIGNGAVETIQRLPDAHVFRFAVTKPISTYLFAFAAGAFVALDARTAPGRLWVRRSQIRRARAHVDEILTLNARAVSAFARYFGRRFPFAKYDLVAIPELPYRGMEHAGATFLAERDLFPPAGCGPTARLERAQLIFHEAAHQWAGNLVTMRAFDDLWLKEGFANFMAYRLAARTLPQARAEVAFQQLKLQACRADETGAAPALHQPLADHALAKTAYGPIVYAKAPAVLRQLESELGAKRFARGVRTWIRRHAYGASDWRDLVRALEDAAGVSLQRCARAWILRPGVPRLQTQVGDDASGYARVQIVQSAADGSRGQSWPLRLRIDVAREGRASESHNVLLDGKCAELRLPYRAATIDRIVVDADGDAYAIVACDPEHFESAGAAIARTRSELKRIQLWECVWQSVRNNRVDPVRFVSLALDAVASERNELILASVLQRVHTAMDRLLPPQRAQSAAAQVDAFLLDQARRAAPELRPAWLEGLLALARTVEGLQALEAIALGRRSALAPAPSPLRQRAALMLVVRGRWSARRASAAIGASPATRATLRRQLAAARPSAQAKREAFEALRADSGASDEALIATLSLLNHPAHAALTESLLGAALRALPALHRRRKIFFVNRWIGAFVDGQCSERAQHAVERAIARGDLDEPIRRKLEEALHELARAVSIRRRWS